MSTSVSENAEAATIEEHLTRYRRAADEAAFEAIVRATQPGLTAAAARICGRDEAQDCVQAAYYSLLRKTALPEGVPVRAWLITAVVRGAYRRVADRRRQSRIAEKLGIAESSTASHPAEQAEEVMLLWRELERLPEKYRDVVVLHHLQGLSLIETAAILCIPPATVGTHLHRARKILRSRLGPRFALAAFMLPWWCCDRAMACAASPALTPVVTGVFMSKRVVVLLAIFFFALTSGLGVMFWRAAPASVIAPSPNDSTALGAAGARAAEGIGESDDSQTAAVIDPARARERAAAAAAATRAADEARARSAQAAAAGDSSAAAISSAGAAAAAEDPVATDAVILEVLVIESASATPTEGAMVDLIRADPEDESMDRRSDQIESSSTTGADGRVRFNTAPGLLGVVARTPLGSTAIVYRELAAGDHQLTIQLHSLLQFIVSVRSDATGEPIAGAPVEVQCRRPATDNARDAVQITRDLKTGADGQVATAVAEDATVVVIVWMKGYRIEQKEFAAREAFGELRLVVARNVSVSLPPTSRQAVVSLRQGNRSTVTSISRDGEEPFECVFDSATEEPAHLIIDAGAPYAISVIAIPAGGDQAVEFQPRTDGGAITLTMAAAFNGSVRILLGGIEITSEHQLAIAAGESLVIDRLAPDLDYEVELFISSADDQPARRATAGIAHVTPGGNTVIEIPSALLDPALPETR